MSHSEQAHTVDIERVVAALGSAIRENFTAPAVETAAAVIAADALAFALCCRVEELKETRGTVQVAVGNISHAISGRGVVTADSGDRSPAFNALYAEYSSALAHKVVLWGLDPADVLPLAAQLLYSAEALKCTTDLAASLEAAAL